MSLNLKQSQNLVITPQLRQAIKLLTLTHLQMTQEIAKEMVENPMLEESESMSTREEIAKDERGTKEAQSDDFSGPEIVDKGKDDFDWDKYADSFNSTSSTPYTKESFSKDDAPNYENMVSRGDTLQEHLEWQLRMEELSEDELNFALSIIHNINDEGYLDENIEELIAKGKLERDLALDMLHLIQNFDPVGCAARDLRECLLIQAYALPDHVPLVELLIKNHLDDLIQKDFKKISKDTGIDINRIKDAEYILHSLNPKPGRTVSAEATQYVIPDIYIKDIGGEFVVKLNDEGVPKLKINNLYKKLIKQEGKTPANDEASEYVQEKLRAALWLIKSIENRQKTIEKVTNAILKNQPEFFKKGAAHLKPMILKDIANEIGVHESTVSRVTKDKYVHTPLGTFELKYFFNAGIGGKNGGIDIANESLKLKIKELIDNEDKKKPLSDQKIADILSKSDIKVARRTIAKYREALNILSSSKRKQKS